MDASRFRLTARDASYAEVDILDDFDTFDCTLNLNDEGRWQLTGLPAEHPAAATLAYTSQTRGRQGVVLRLDDRIVMSGRVVDVREYDGTDGRLIDVLLGIDDTARLTAAYASPEPASLPPYQVESHDVRTGPSETLLHEYVSANVGPGALAERRDYVLPGLATDGGSGRGTVITKRARLDPLLDWLREIAEVDGLVFEVVQSDAVPGQLDFRTRMPGDRTGLVVFSPAHRTVSETARTEYSARSNYVLGMADGEGTDRLFASRSDADSIDRHGRWEVVSDQRGARTETELGAAIAKALADGLGGYEIAVSPLDVVGAEFGRDYGLGDRVTTVVLGASGTGIVSSVAIRISGNEATISPTVTTVGGPARTAPRSSTLGRVSARLHRLEANAESQIVPQMVMHWAGALGDIPFGWVLADGTSGTPNVLGRMIVGAGGTFALGDTGGAGTANLQHSHAILSANLAHAHGAGTLAAADHSHAAGTLAAASHGHGSGTLAAAGHQHTMGHTHPGSHSHGFTTGNQIGASSSGTTGATNPVTYDPHHHGGTTDPDSNAPASSAADTGNVGASVSGTTASIGAAVSGTTAAGGTLAVSGTTASGGPGTIATETTFGTSVSILPPFIGLYPICRIAA